MNEKKSPEVINYIIGFGTGGIEAVLTNPLNVIKIQMQQRKSWLG